MGSLKCLLGPCIQACLREYTMEIKALNVRVCDLVDPGLNMVTAFSTLNKDWWDTSLSQLPKNKPIKYDKSIHAITNLIYIYIETREVAACQLTFIKIKTFIIKKKNLFPNLVATIQIT